MRNNRWAVIDYTDRENIVSKTGLTYSQGERLMSMLNKRGRTLVALVRDKS